MQRGVSIRLQFLFALFGGLCSVHASAQPQESIPFSRETKVTLSPRTKLPRRVLDINVTPRQLRETKQALTEKNAEAVFKGFLAEHSQFFRVQPEQLRMTLAARRNGTWYVRFQQYYKGVPVHQATIGLTATKDGMIKTYGSSYHPDIDVDTVPKIALARAVEIAKTTYDSAVRERLKEKQGSLLIYPEEKKERVTFHLAWKFLLSAARPDPEVEKYFIVSATDGAILKSYPARFPGAEARGRMQGQIFPANPTDTVTTASFSREHVDLSSQGWGWHKRLTTDQKGDFRTQLPWWYVFLSRYDAASRLRGPYVTVQDSGGNDYVHTQRCRKNTACDHTWTAADLDHVSVFYHMNLIREWYKTRFNHEWSNAWDNSSQFHAEVNHPFNNAYAGDPIQFGTDNFARSSDVVYHECTHNVLYAMFGDWIGFPNTHDESYAFDEGFADYFSCSLTEDPRHGEGYGSTRTLNNDNQYDGKAIYNLEGHSGGVIIAGAAWDFRARMISRRGAAAGSLYADNAVFDALRHMSTMPRDYYFSDPQESNFLTSLYVADDDNNNLTDGTPNFHDIHRSFAGHGLLQATLRNGNSYDVSANAIGSYTGGDFYFHGGSFWANNVGQRGVIDLGDIGAVSLDAVSIPLAGYTRFGLAAAVNHTYVSLAHQGEEGSYVVFRVTSFDSASNEAVIRYVHRTPLRLDPTEICERFPQLCEPLFPCRKYPALCEPVILVPERDLLRVRFRHQVDRLVIPVERLCLFVLNCPGCGPDGLCAGYSLVFRNMPDAFGIEVYDSKGTSVARDLGTGRAKRIDFRSEPGVRYFLVIRPGKETKTGVEYSLLVAFESR